MPLFDKIKAQAAQVAQMAQDAGKAGQAKIDQVQSKRQLDALYRDLGAAVYAERIGEGAGQSGVEIERLVVAITAHIAENGPDTDDDADAASTTTTTTTSTTTTATNSEPPKASYGS